MAFTLALTFDASPLADGAVKVPVSVFDASSLADGALKLSLPAFTEAAPSTYTMTMAGGVILSGTAPKSFVLGGITYYDPLIFQPSGGVILGGTASTTFVTVLQDIEYPSGGVILGGTAPVSLVWTQKYMTGGIVISGSAGVSFSSSVLNAYAVKTFQYLTKVMTGGSGASKTLQGFTKSMTAFSGQISSMTKTMQPFVKSMVTWSEGSMSKVMQYGTKLMTGGHGVIVSSVKTLQYFTKETDGYIEVTGTLDRTMFPFYKAMLGVIQEGSTYSVVSMHTEWQALAQYTNYNFNSFATFNGKFIGASSSGLYLLEGDTDDGTNIDAVVRTGTTDMGTSHLKKLEYVYVGYRATGDLLLRVYTNDLQTRDYRVAYDGQPGLFVKRVKLGKGVIAKYWQLEIQNTNGSDFNLNSLELKPTILSRRVQGGRA